MTREITAPSRGSVRRARYREIAKVLWEERVLNLMRGSDLEAHAPSPVDGDVHAAEAPASGARVRERDLPRAVRIRHALERLGPAFVKMGQLLATRRDLVTPDLAAELAKLQDDVPTLSWDEMRPRIEAELGAPVEDVFATFDHEPIAAASIGQVYRATLDDGTTVAVKVQRPGVTETMEIDLEILVEQARRLEAHTQWGRDFDVGALATEFADVLRSELDYTHEGRALDRFRAAFADTPDVTFPGVYWDHTTSRVLTMDFVEGVPATRLEDENVSGVDRGAIVDTGVSCYMRQIFELGYYHADPHAGNIFALGGGRIAFVDFGRVATISERNRDATFDMLLAVFSDDPAQATEAVLAMTGTPPHVDVATMEMELGALLASYRRSQTTGGGLEELMQKLLTLMREHRLHLPTELTVLLTTLGMVDGTARQIDPDFELADSVRPMARKLIPQQFGPEKMLKHAMSSGRAYARFFDHLPLHLTRVLRRAGEGEFRVSIRPTEFKPIMDRLEAAFTRLAYALIIAALIIGFSFLVSRPGLSSAERIGYRVVLFVTLASVAWFLFSLARIELRKRREEKHPTD
jgi:ubiquinone biosynthesis protein